MKPDLKIIDHVPNILCVLDAMGKWLQASPDYLKMLGLENVPFYGKTSKELSLLASDCEYALHLNSLKFDQALQKSEPYTYLDIIKNPDQSKQTLEITITPIYDKNQQPFLLLVSASNAIQKKSQLRALHLAASVFRHNHEAILLIDLDFKIIRVNQAFTELTGLLENNIKGRHLSAISNQRNNHILFTTLLTCLKNSGQWQGVFSCRKAEGQDFDARLNLTTAYSSRDKQANHYIAYLSNNTKKNDAEEQDTLRLSQYDEITELPNWFMLIERLNQFLSRSKRHNLNTVLIFINLKQLKTEIDKLGFPGNLQLLKEISQRLSGLVRCEDTVARLSEDKFAILLDNHNSYEQAQYAGSLIAEKIIAALTQAFTIKDQEIMLDVNVGISIYPDDARTTQDLLKNAEIALFQAKNSGKNSFQYFEANFNIALNDKLQLVIDIRNALENEEFRLFYQPQYDAKSRQLVGAEVLVRWFTNEHIMVPPLYFIPIAEETGLIIDLGQWILETACKQQKTWLDENFLISKVAVNISVRQLIDPNFVQMVEDTLKKTDLEPKHLELEIAETTLLNNTPSVMLKLQSLHKLGINLAIDNFGADLTNLSIIEDLPLHTLKIDKSIVADVPDNGNDMENICRIIEFGHAQGLKIVAEGVETEEQLKLLQKKECDILQGYLFNPPLPENEMHEQLQK